MDACSCCAPGYLPTDDKIHVHLSCDPKDFATKVASGTFTEVIDAGPFRLTISIERIETTKEAA